MSRWVKRRLARWLAPEIRAELIREAGVMGLGSQIYYASSGFPGAITFSGGGGGIGGLKNDG